MHVYPNQRHKRRIEGLGLTIAPILFLSLSLRVVALECYNFPESASGRIWALSETLPAYDPEGFSVFTLMAFQLPKTRRGPHGL